ncbi:DUF1016 N-terminal domain-containing protein [Nitrincola sp. A-D6]|uniref:DUF1016 N-terminal domain-containing protein n=1 Tax=Nitrincola sp. A-D6 TaxID=1545442 RepID=UPI003FA5BE2B
MKSLKSKNSASGEKVLAQLSQDLMAEFPKIKGFSKRNLELIRQWYIFWNQDVAITQQAVAQLVLIPWGHNQALPENLKSSLPSVEEIEQELARELDDN